MSTIQIADLSPAGSELFQDTESFLNELTENELMVMGGKKGFKGIVINVNVGSVNIYTLFTINTNTVNANTIGNNNGG